MNKTKRIPFSIERAKAGARVVTEEGNSARIVDFNRKTESTYKIVAEVLIDNGDEYPFIYDHLGEPRNDIGPKLFIEEEIKTRRMTYKELSWWLREHPEEHREYTHEDMRKSSLNVYSCYDYNTSYADEEVNEYIRIRKNGGEWFFPLVEI